MMVFVPIHAEVLSWSINDEPSLKLTDMIGVVYSNNAIMSDSAYSTNLIRIEYIELLDGHHFGRMFVRFQKRKFPSFLRVKIFDLFTDTELCRADFHEQDFFDLSSRQHIVGSVYLVVELHGDDIELRRVGIEMIPRNIIEELFINSDTIHASSDFLEISTTLQEDAIVTLLIYNREGDVCKSFFINHVLSEGSYQFYLDPQDLSYDYAGDKRYYVWLYSENLRSKPVEFVKKFNIIP